MTNQQAKVKGVADIVFLMDATGSMQRCIDGLKRNVESFIDFLTTGAGNTVSPVKDWRARVVGFRDVETDGAKWFVDNPFVRDAIALKAQLAALTAEGGGDEPESLLDAIFMVSKAGQTDKGAPEDPARWRYRSAAARVVVVFTDASYKPVMGIPEARGGTIDDVRNAVQDNRIILSVFAPDQPCFNDLSALDKAEYVPIPADSGLEAFTADQANFRETLRQLAASVSASSETVAL